MRAPAAARRWGLPPVWSALRLALAIVPTALRRLRANLGLALCALLALVAAVALAVSVPLYAEAASLRVLRDEIARQEQQRGRSAFALLFRYVGAWNGPLEWQRVAPVDAYITGPGLQYLGLPLQGLARHARTDELRLFFPPSAGGDNQLLTNVMLGFLEGMTPQMRIVDGEQPRPATDLAQPVDVLAMRAFADQVGINVGNEFTVVAPAGSQVVAIPIRIAGLWEPVSTVDPAWFFPPDAFQNVLLVPEATFTGPLAATLQNEVGQVLWFARLDGAGVTATSAAPLLGRIEAVRAQIAGAVPGLRLEQSPAEALQRYRQESTALLLQLFVFSTPIMALILYFVALVAGLLVQRQRSEIALLKTRGVRDTQIVGIATVEWLLLGALALLIGPLLGLVFARTMSQTRSFLALAAESSALALDLRVDHLRYGAGVVLLALAAALAPMLHATRRTLVDEQQQTARVLRPPWWQRWYLDGLLLLPAGYGLYQLHRGGGLQLGALGGADPLQNPLLLLVPVLLCCALGLLAVRLIPRLLELLAWLAARPAWIAPLLALRALARQPDAYRGPLLLLILTLSLATFSAAMAATHDAALQSAIRYQVGAQTQLLETGQSTEQPAAGQPGAQPQAAEQRDIREEPRFLFIPVSDHLEVPGILAVARVGTYEATIPLGGVNRPAQLVGLDRLDFPKVVTFFDPAWAGGESLGGLMNRLARAPDGVIVSRAVLDGGFAVGDSLPATLNLYGDRREVRFRIVAAVDLWPGYYPQDGPLLIANLNYIFDQMGGQYPYDVWIARDPNADLQALVQGARQLGFTVIDARDTATILAEEQARPRRQGVFGILSVGFVAAGALTLLGFLLASLITARRRVIELGVLQALGLSRCQTALALGLEQTLLVAAGSGAGTGIGLLTAVLVVPQLQAGAGPYPGTPPYVAQLAWNQILLIYAIFAIALLATLLALAWALRRMQLFQAVKLGDVN